MSPTEPSRETVDGVDMAKLQKTLKQQERHSRPRVKKLTPAEIRSLNYEVAEAKQPSHTAQPKSRRSNGSQPLVPGNDRYRSLPKSSTVPLPTPPRSPVGREGRSSKHDRKDRNHGQLHPSSSTNFPAEHGRSSRTSSVSSHQSGRSLQMYRGREVTQTGNPSMLRHPKPEIVTNPLSMFSRPRQSQLQASNSPDKFRRDFMELDPYQAQAMLDDDDGDDDGGLGARQTGSERVMESPVSMDDSHQVADKETPTSKDGTEGSSTLRQSTRSLSSANGSSHATIKPHTEPESVMGDTVQTEKEPKVGNSKEVETGASARQSYTQTVRDQTNKLITSPELAPVDSEVMPVAAADRNSERAVGEPEVRPVTSNVPVQSANSTDLMDGKDVRRKRFTFHHMFDKKDQEKVDAEPKRQRRRTLSFTKTPDASPKAPSQTFEDEPQPADGPSTEPQAPSHPAVRPLNTATDIAPSATKSKLSDPAPLSVPSAPTYGRCACCGKVKKPGYSSELSPVMENENLHTNFVVEAERASHESPRRYTAIIPMQVRGDSDGGSVRTVQASIEPKSPQSGASNMVTPRTSTDTRHADNSSVSSGVHQASRDPSIGETITKPNKRHTLEEAKVVRFASLHGRRGSESDIPSAFEQQNVEEEIVQSVPYVPPVTQPQRSLLAPSEFELSRQRQLQSKAVPTMSGAVPRPPHPLRQSSPIDQLVENLHNEHGGSIIEATQQQVKRVPKQDIITVIPVKKSFGNNNASTQASQAAEIEAGSSLKPDADAAEPVTKDLKVKADTTESVAVKQPSPSSTGPKKLKKQQTTEYPPSAFPNTGKKGRRLSLPLGFRLPNSKRASASSATFSVPYAASEAGKLPDTDPSNKPALPSQTSTARTSFASAVSELGDRSGRTEARKRSSSIASSIRDRFHSTSREPTGPTVQGISSGDTANAGHHNAGMSAGGKEVRPSPSFAKFISNLPATHAKDVPEPRRLFGMRRTSLQQPPTITENKLTPKIASNGETVSKDNSTTHGRTKSPAMQTQMPQSVSLPVLKLGEQDDGWAGGETLTGLMNNGVAGHHSKTTNGLASGPGQHGVNAVNTTQKLQQKANEMELTASPIEIRDAINGTSGGFVGGRKLEMLLRRDMALVEVANV